MREFSWQDQCGGCQLHSCLNPWARSQHRLGTMDMLLWATVCCTPTTFLHLLQSACLWSMLMQNMLKPMLLSMLVQTRIERIRLRWGMKLVKLKLQTRLIKPLTVGPWTHLDLQHLKNVEGQTALLCLVAPKSNVLEMTSQQHRGTTPWILQVSELQRLRGLKILCFRWQALTWAFTSTKILQWNLTSTVMMLTTWTSMTWSFMMISFFMRTTHVWLVMQTCPRSRSNLRFLTLPKNPDSVLMNSCVWMRWQASLNFKGWNVWRFYKALTVCHLLLRCWALDLCALGAKNTIQRAKQFGWGDQGSLPVSSLGWSLREKTYLAQRLAVSFPEFCQQFSWKDVRKRTWWWRAWTWEMPFWLWNKEKIPWSVQQMQVEQYVVTLWEKCSLDSAMGVCFGIAQPPASSNQNLAWKSTPHIHAFFVQKMDLAWWWYMLTICLWLESVTMCWASSCPNSKLHMIFQCNALRNQVIDLTFLKRQYTLHDDGRLTIQTREKHITQLCSLLGLKVRNQNKKNPAHADIEKKMTQQNFHLHQPQLSELALFWCIWRMMFHKLNMSFDIWQPTVQNPLRRVWQCLDIFFPTSGGISLQPHGHLRIFEMGWSSNWHFSWLSKRGCKWTCFGGVHWLRLGFRPCQQKVCKLLHCDVWKVLDILSIKDSKNHLVVISWIWSLRLQLWSQWRHLTCQVVDMDHQQKNPYLHLH